MGCLDHAPTAPAEPGFSGPLLFLPPQLASNVQPSEKQGLCPALSCPVSGARASRHFFEEPSWKGFEAQLGSEDFQMPRSNVGKLCLPMPMAVLCPELLIDIWLCANVLLSQ